MIDLIKRLFGWGLIVCLCTKAAFSAPLIRLISPDEDFFSHKSSVLFKGQTKDISALTINDVPVSIGTNGQFYVKKLLSKPNSYHVFVLKGTNDAGEVAELTRKIYYYPVDDLPPPPLDSGDGPSIQLISPKEGEISIKSELFVKGWAKDSQSIKINEKGVEIEESGRFSTAIQLATPNALQPVRVVATDSEGASTQLVRYVYFRPDPVSDQPPATLGTTDSAELDLVVPEPVPPTSLPVLSIMLPTANFYTIKDKVLFKGHAKNTQKLTLNGEPISLDEAGKFYFKAPRVTPNVTHHFLVRAEGKDGVYVTENRKVFFAETDIPSLTTSVDNGVIRGIAKKTVSLTANGQEVDLDSSGRFEIPAAFTADVESVILVAMSKHKKSATKTVSVEPVPQTPPAILTLYHPPNNFFAARPKVLLKGEVKGATKIHINGKQIPLEENRFYAVEPLETPNAYHFFNIDIFSPDGTVQTVSRKVFYDKKSETSPPQPTKAPPAQPPEAPQQKTPLAKVTSPPPSVPKQVASNINLRVDSPKPYDVISYQDVTFKGTLTGASDFFINNRHVIPNGSGAFSEVFDVGQPGKHTFNLYAIEENGQAVTKLIDVYYIPDTNSQDVVEHTEVDENLAKTISLDLVDAPIQDVLKILAKEADLNIVSDRSLAGSVSVTLKQTSVADAIDLILNTQGLAYKIVNNTVVVAPASHLTSPTSYQTRIIRINNASGSEVASLLQSYLSAGETIQFVEQSNLLVVYAGPQKIDQISRIVERVDRQKIPQIILEARILETSTTALEQMGIAWPRSVGYGYSNQTTDGTTVVERGFSVSAILNLLEENGDAKILARPQIKALHNQEAEIFIGDEVPYTETNVDLTGRVSESVQFAELGISLKILPIINHDTGEIRIKIEPEVSYIFTFRGTNNDIPWIKTRRVTTTVSVSDGETVIIGGLFNSTDSANVAKVPFIGNLPILGNLFTNNRGDQAETELIITITPRIVDEASGLISSDN